METIFLMPLLVNFDSQCLLFYFLGNNQDKKYLLGKNKIQIVKEVNNYLPIIYLPIVFYLAHVGSILACIENREISRFSP